MLEFKCDPALDPPWLPKIDTSPEPDTVKVCGCALEVIYAVADFHRNLTYLQAYRDQFGIPSNEHLMRAVVAKFQDIMGAAGPDLAKLVILYATPTSSVYSFLDAVDQTFREQTEKKVMATQTREVWARAKAFGHAGFPQSSDETDPVGS